MHYMRAWVLCGAVFLAACGEEVLPPDAAVVFDSGFEFAEEGTLSCDAVGRLWCTAGTNTAPVGVSAEALCEVAPCEEYGPVDDCTCVLYRRPSM